MIHGESTEFPCRLEALNTMPILFIILPFPLTKNVSRVASVITITMQQQPPTERRSRPRQEPVSCQSCRAKKLRCNRQLPCSNCLARGITCLNQSRLPVLNERSQREPTTSTSSDNDSAAILTRLKRLEDLLLGFDGTCVPLPRSDALRSHSVTPSARSRGDEISKTDSEFLEDVGIRTDFLVGAVSFS